MPHLVGLAPHRAVIQTGFESIAGMMIALEDIVAAVNRRMERSEAAIITNVNREAKKFQGDAGNHKTIQALKMLEPAPLLK